MNIKNGLLSITEYCENSRDFQAIRGGFILMIPVVIIASFALVFIAFPIPAYQSWMHSLSCSGLYHELLLIRTASADYLSLLLCAAFSWSYAREWQLPSYQCCLLPLTAIGCFFIGAGIGTPAYRSDYLGSAGMLTGIFTAVFISRLYILLLSKTRVLCPLESYHIDPRLHHIIYSVFPMAGALVIMVLLQTLIQYCTGGICLQAQAAITLTAVFRHFQYAPLPAGLLFITMTQLLWFFGIHGQNVLYDINSNYYNELLQQNITAAAAGDAPVHIINLIFNNSYLLMGGSGCSLALIIAILLVSRSGQARTISRLSFIPACFNISEIMLFGLPVILNPVFVLPFLAVPIVNMLTAFAFTAAGIVPVLARDVSWITPPLLSGFLTAGLPGLCLQVFLLGIDICIYIPFIRIYDQQEVHSFKKDVRELENIYQELESRNEPLRLDQLNHHRQTTAIQLISDLGRALSRQQLFLVYQPQFNIQSKMIGAEALLRWKHDRAGYIYPPLILALAKAGSQLPRLESFIFQAACETASLLSDKLPEDYHISFNICGDSLRYPELEENIRHSLQQFAISPRNIGIEITEHDAIASTSITMDKLYRLKNSGYLLFIDDFGMGHTSITYLKSNIFDVVKLDSSITTTVLSNPNSQEIIASLVQLTKSLHLHIVAEFVDNIPQRDKLNALGCEVFQGYLYSPPISRTELIALYHKHFDKNKTDNKNEISQ